MTVCRATLFPFSVTARAARTFTLVLLLVVRTASVLGIAVAFLAVAGCEKTEDPAGEPASDPTGEQRGAEPRAVGLHQPTMQRFSLRRFLVGSSSHRVVGPDALHQAGVDAGVIAVDAQDGGDHRHQRNSRYSRHRRSSVGRARAPSIDSWLYLNRLPSLKRDYTDRRDSAPRTHVDSCGSGC